MQIFQVSKNTNGIEYTAHKTKVVFGNKYLTYEDIIKKHPNIKFNKLNQQHTTHIAIKDPKSSPCDGYQWDKANTSVLIRTADCLPLIAIDHELNTLTNLHCGRKGLTDGILNSFLKIAKPEHPYSFFIGPHIMNYEIGPDLYNELKPKTLTGLYVKEDKYYFSMADYVKNFIVNYFKFNKIYECNTDTLTDPNFWSYRGDNKTLERNYSFAFFED